MSLPLSSSSSVDNLTDSSFDYDDNDDGNKAYDSRFLTININSIFDLDRIFKSSPLLEFHRVVSLRLNFNECVTSQQLNSTGQLLDVDIRKIQRGLAVLSENIDILEIRDKKKIFSDYELDKGICEFKKITQFRGDLSDNTQKFLNLCPKVEKVTLFMNHNKNLDIFNLAEIKEKNKTIKTLEINLDSFLGNKYEIKIVDDSSRDFLRRPLQNTMNKQTNTGDLEELIISAMDKLQHLYFRWRIIRETNQQSHKSQTITGVKRKFNDVDEDDEVEERFGNIPAYAEKDIRNFCCKEILSSPSHPKLKHYLKEAQRQINSWIQN